MEQLFDVVEVLERLELRLVSHPFNGQHRLLVVEPAKKHELLFHACKYAVDGMDALIITHAKCPGSNDHEQLVQAFKAVIQQPPIHFGQVYELFRFESARSLKAPVGSFVFLDDALLVVYDLDHASVFLYCGTDQGERIKKEVMELEIAAGDDFDLGIAVGDDFIAVIHPLQDFPQLIELLDIEDEYGGFMFLCPGRQWN